MSRMGQPGQLTGAFDRNGIEIKIGDKLRFDHDEWNKDREPRHYEDCTFVMEYSNGQLQHPGSYSDLSQWCEIIEKA